MKQNINEHYIKLCTRMSIPVRVRTINGSGAPIQEIKKEKRVAPDGDGSSFINIHNMKLHPDPFEMIKSGEKTIELRLFDEKRRRIRPGDRIVFTDTASGEMLDTTVVRLHRFDSFEELYGSLPLLKCGYTAENVGGARPSDMEQYYSIEEQSKFGVVGIELRLTERGSV